MYISATSTAVREILVFFAACVLNMKNFFLKNSLFAPFVTHIII